LGERKEKKRVNVVVVNGTVCLVEEPTQFSIRRIVAPRSVAAILYIIFFQNFVRFTS
jgi:predicted aconitase